MRKQLISGAASVAVMSALALDHGHAVRWGQKDGGGGQDEQDPKAIAKKLSELNEALVKRDGEIKSALEKYDEALKAGATKEALDAVTAQLKTLTENGTAMQAKMTELEQIAARSVSNDNVGAKSLGQLATESDEFQAAIKKGSSAFRGSARFEQKATIVSTEGNADGNAGALINPTRVPGIVRPNDRVLRIRDLLMPGRTSSNSIEYVKESGFTNNAAPVAETQPKPQSDLKFTRETTPVRTIAHWVLASKQVLDDVPMLQSYIDGRLRYGLAFVEEAQFLKGDGTDENILGLVPQSTNFDSSRSEATDTYIDTIRRAMTQVRLAEYRASGIVMHPADWERIELTKDANGGYIFANPQNLAGPTLWGRPVIESMSMEEGEFLVGAFNLAAQIFDRQDSTVEIATEDSDNFRKNLITIRAEERTALAVYREEAIVHGFFEGPTGTN